MRNAKKLKGTNVFLYEDLCPASQAVKMAQMPLLKQARAQGKVAFFRHTKLIIKERNSVVEDGEGQRSTRAVGAVGGTTDGNVVVEAAGAWAGAKVDSLAAQTQPNAPGTRSRATPTSPITPTPGASTSSVQRGTTRRAATDRRGTSNDEEASNTPQHNMKTASHKKK